MQNEFPSSGTWPKPKVDYPNVGQPNERFLKKVYVQTWGCQMNVADTERMLSLLGTRNYRPTSVPEDADLILLNTCHIREKARHKVVSRLGELRPLKVSRPETILAISGCVAQAEAEKLAKEVPFVDLIFGPDQIEDLPALLEKAVVQAEIMAPWVNVENRGHTPHGAPIVETKFKKEGYSIPIDVVPPWVDDGRPEVSRYINIIKGCNNFCTFCVVPYTRGREKSRPVEEILAETRHFVASGVKEVVLLGQNVNSYGLDLVAAPASGQLPFAELLYQVAAVPGLERIRFTTSNPHDFTPELAKAFADLPQVTNQFHLPVQSGSTRILERMNRQYTRAEYLERVAWIRNVRPEIAFSTDIIVGFPGESDADFDETMDLVAKMKYAFIYAFKYSPRRGTPATRFHEQVPEDVKDRRLQALLALQREETERQNLAEVGHARNVLILYANPKQENTWYGRTYEGRLVKVASPRNLLGHTLPVNITGANITALEGHPA